MSTSVLQNHTNCPSTNIEIPIPQYRLFTIHRETPQQDTLDLSPMELSNIQVEDPIKKECGFKLNKATFQKLKIRMLKAKRNKRLMMLSKATTCAASKKNISPPSEGFYCLKEPKRKETCSQIDFKMEEEHKNEVPLNRKRIQRILSIFDERVLKTKKLVELRRQKGCCKVFELLEKKNTVLRNQESNVVAGLNKTIKKLKDRIKEMTELEF